LSMPSWARLARATSSIAWRVVDRDHPVSSRGKASGEKSGAGADVEHGFCVVNGDRVGDRLDDRSS
jgi:hypothetical protein